MLESGALRSDWRHLWLSDGNAMANAQGWGFEKYLHYNWCPWGGISKIFALLMVPRGGILTNIRSFLVPRGGFD